jgi:hypothetical protein
VLGTYGSFLLIFGLAALSGQAIFALCGLRTWSALSPAVGLAALTAIAWGTVRLPGQGTASLVAIVAVGAASALYLRGRLEDLGTALLLTAPLGLAAVLAASLPFFVERRFGILGTGLDPDMSQHLLVAFQLAHGEGGRLIAAGYPLGPHSLVVALSALGVSLVHGFDGLTLAAAVASCLAPLAILWRLSAPRRIAACLLVGLGYMAATYFVQGSFKESLEALFVLAFAIGLHQLATGGLFPTRSPPQLRAVPLAVLAVGTIYCYSFPGLFWLIAATAVWAAAELALRARGSLAATLAAARSSAAPLAGALVVLAAASAPEIGRMMSFAGFSTFNPAGPGLGNLFNRISPLEALGIWPSGDFRVEPGGGFAPAPTFWIGSALALAALAFGLAWWLRRRELAVPAALGGAALLILYSLAVGTPYQEAKAIAIASPLAILVAVRPVAELLRARPRGGLVTLGAAAGVAFVVGAAASSALVLANGPVGPASWGPALRGLHAVVGRRSTLVLASPELLADEHGRDFLVWELRGSRVCVQASGATSSKVPPHGVSYVITSSDGAQPPFRDLRLDRRAGPYRLWARRPLPAGNGRCPLIVPGGGARANPAPG